MNNMPKTRKLPIGLLIASLLLVIFGYNYWSFQGGRCTVASLLSLSAPAILLILMIVVAGGVLMWGKARNHRQQLNRRCGCGTELRGTWSFCPSCGSARKEQST